nr:TPR repeat-containing protein ZIP4-like [Ziziphus jujuba var. spinosa]
MDLGAYFVRHHSVRRIQSSAPCCFFVFFMKIAEISSPDHRQGHHDSQFQQQHHLHLVSQIESSIKQAENLSPGKPLPVTISDDLRKYLNQLSQLAPFPNSLKLLVWKLSYRLWNACVDLSNAASIRSRYPSSSSSSRKIPPKSMPSSAYRRRPTSCSPAE